MNDIYNKNIIEPFIIDTSTVPVETERYIASRLSKMEIAEIRKSMKLTQKQLSEISGLSTQCISDIENDSGNPTLKSLVKYLTALGHELSFKKQNIE